MTSVTTADFQETLGDYDKQVQETSRVASQLSKSTEKKDTLKQSLHEMEQQTKVMGTKTLALLVVCTFLILLGNSVKDTEDRLELVLMEQILAYMTTYKVSFTALHS